MPFCCRTVEDRLPLERRTGGGGTVNKGLRDSQRGDVS